MSCLTRKAAAYTRQPDYDKLSQLPGTLSQPTRYVGARPAGKSRRHPGHACSFGQCGSFLPHPLAAAPLGPPQPRQQAHGAALGAWRWPWAWRRAWRQAWRGAWRGGWWRAGSRGGMISPPASPSLPHEQSRQPLFPMRRRSHTVTSSGSRPPAGRSRRQRRWRPSPHSSPSSQANEPPGRSSWKVAVGWNDPGAGATHERQRGGQG